MADNKTGYDDVAATLKNQAREDLDHIKKLNETEGCVELASTIKNCENLLAHYSQDLPLTLLSSQAYVDDRDCFDLTASERTLRQGRFPHHVRGFEVDYIDDYTENDPVILIGAIGDVKTLANKLLTVKAGRLSSASRMFHMVKPHRENDFDYLFHVLRNTDASPCLQGTTAVKVVPIELLKILRIPWPDETLRRLFSTCLESFDNIPSEMYSKKSKVLLQKAKLSIASYFLSSTKNPDKLRSLVESEEEKANNKPTMFIDDPAEPVYTIIENLIVARFPDVSAEEILDAVASTSDLAAGSTGMKAKVVACFPPANQEEWAPDGIDPDDSRWVLGFPPKNKANYAWIQQTIDCMAKESIGILILCNSALHSELGKEKDLRANFAQSGLVRCIISLPGGTFPDRRPPSSVVVLEKGRASSDVLFVDLQELGITYDTTQIPHLRYLPGNAVVKVVNAFMSGDSANLPCREVSLDEIAHHQNRLTPWLYTQH